jgi:hypothetical protein
MESPLAHAIRNKLQMIIKRIQDRKTAEIFKNNITYDEIQDLLEISEEQQGSQHQEDKSVVSFLSTMKTIAHTTQSKTRWEEFVKTHNIDNEIYTFSSKGDFNNMDQIIKKLGLPSVPKHIVMCTHVVRMKDLLEIAKYLEGLNTQLRIPRKLRIYLDEFDKYADQMRPIINQLVMLNCVEVIVLVTATPKKLWAMQPEWRNIFLLNPQIEDPGSYLMFKDCQHIYAGSLDTIEPITIDWLDVERSEDKALIDLHGRVMRQFPNILEPGRVIFAPGNVRRVSHETVGKFWNHFGCAVMIINGQRTTEGYYGALILSDHSVIDIPHMRREDFESETMIKYFERTGELQTSDAQLNEIISELYCRYNLSATPLVITGRLCVERAQTLVHPVWGTFSDAIYYKATDPDDAYQQQRQLGHIKNWDTYRGIPRVISPEQFRRDVLILEARADNFAKRHGGNFVTLEDYVSAGGGTLTSKEKKEKKTGERKETREQIEIHPDPFTTIEEVNTFLTDKTKARVAIRPFHTVDGYQLSTRLNTYYKKKKGELVAEDRLTKEKYDRLKSRGLNISGNKGQSYMVYPVYPTMMAAPNEVEYYVSYLPPPPAPSI